MSRKQLRKWLLRKEGIRHSQDNGVAIQGSTRGTISHRGIILCLRLKPDINHHLTTDNSGTHGAINHGEKSASKWRSTNLNPSKRSPRLPTKGKAINLGSSGSNLGILLSTNSTRAISPESNLSISFTRSRPFSRATNKAIGMPLRNTTIPTSATLATCICTELSLLYTCY